MGYREQIRGQENPPALGMSTQNVPHITGCKATQGHQTPRL